MCIAVTTQRILIKKPLVKVENSQYQIEFPIISGDKTQLLWYSIDEKYKDFICIDSADGVITTLLPYAIRGGYDIESELRKKLLASLADSRQTIEDTVRIFWQSRSLKTRLKQKAKNFILLMPRPVLTFFKGLV